MPRTRLRRVAPWILTALVGVGAWTGGAAALGSPFGPALRPAVGPAVRAVVAEVPEALALPPGAVDRIVDAVAERPEPLRKSLDVALTAGTVLLALGALGRTRRAGMVARAVALRHGPGTTRGPPVAG